MLAKTVEEKKSFEGGFVCEWVDRNERKAEKVSEVLT